MQRTRICSAGVVDGSSHGRGTGTQTPGSLLPTKFKNWSEFSFYRPLLLVPYVREKAAVFVFSVNIWSLCPGPENLHTLLRMNS